MKTLGENKAIELLKEVRERFRSTVKTRYETRAKDCGTCEVRGSCCVDEHFVNVHISSLEAAAIKKSVKEMPEAMRRRVIKKAGAESKRFKDEAGTDSFYFTYSCPLYDRNKGCLVHKSAKPLPCINHACYEKKEDLPPERLLESAERQVGVLNSRVYGNAWTLEPIPVWISRFFVDNWP
ncbi:MAG: hypothetical protein DWQ47_07315 [Acidobacteria bacterium]|nr:MAG: hypothetical protein DWQ32_15415 [Acidobacteriota bacterium]REJ99266.1 MAG: hypothetical protein DWQ38_14560 [Acidobacteriota bacterium]REK16013.1 MAG: hypothetical protein DWQ43_03125 [Acidobacteriota bacterium]REK43694.1 MAG: hypothetical protein DWQ47_07315 [Acidobacteriota bacterium]